MTICTQNGECLFDDPVLRRVAETMWQQIPSHFGRVSLDARVVVPNHMHAILIISDDVRARHSEQVSPLTMAGASEEETAPHHVSSGNTSPLP